MTDNPALIALGAFITSTGLASLVAVAAIYFTWRAGKAQIVENRRIADENDTRQRWWEAVMWFHEHRAEIPEEEFLAGIEALNADEQVKNETQQVILRAVTKAPRSRSRNR